MNKQLYILWALLVVLGSGCPLLRRPSPGVAVKAPPILSYDYSGIRVVQAVSPRDRIELRMVINGGLSQVEEGEIGLEWLALETAFRGGAGEWDAATFAKRADLFWGSLDFSVHPDHSVIRLSCAPAQLSTAWELWVACMVEPRFDPIVFNELKAQRVSQLEQFENEGVGRTGQMARGQVFAGTAYQFSPAGLSSRVAGYTAAQCKRFFKNQLMQRSRLTLVSVGPLDGEEVADLMLGAFEELPLGEERVFANRPEFGPSGIRLSAKDDGIQRLNALVPAPGLEGTERAAFEAALQVLALEARELFRGDPELLRSLHIGMYQDGRDWGQISLSGLRAVPQAERLLSEIRRFRNEGISDEEWQVLRRIVLNRFLAGFDSNRSLADELAARVRYPKPIDLALEVQALESVTAKGLNEAFQTRFDQVTWSYLGDTTKVDRNTLTRQ